LSFRMHSATLGQHSSRRNSARGSLPSMEVFWLAPIVELWRTIGAARATARSSVWFHPSPLPALPAPAAASVVPPAIRGDRCRGCRGQCVGSEERVPCNRRAGGVVGRHKEQSCSKASNDHTTSEREQTGSFCGIRVSPNAYPKDSLGTKNIQKFELWIGFRSIAKLWTWGRSRWRTFFRFRT
jgi:hypothetical protein